MLKAAESEGLDTYRLLLPEVPVTAATKLVDLLPTPYSSDLMDEVTDFERRVTSWMHEPTETQSDSINIGVVIKGLVKECIS